MHSTLVKRFLLNRESKKIRLRLRAERVAARVNDDDDGGGGDTTVIVLSQVTKEEMVNESWLVMVGDGGVYDMLDGVQDLFSFDASLF